MEKREYPKISVLMSVYKNDKPEWIELSVKSVVDQTVKPDEILLIVDGPVSDEIKNKINELEKEIKILKVNALEQNIGLGNVLKMGLPMTKNDIVARMDADDISKPDRFEKQLNYMIENDLDIVGSYIEEFSVDSNKIDSIREVPITMKDVEGYIKSRNPFNHMTVMMKKQKALEAGGYLDMHYCEDYYLWCRMFLSGAKMGNIPESLVLARMNADTFRRRGGMKYFKSQKKLFKFMKQNKIINWFQYMKVTTSRFLIHVMMPGKLKEKIYKKHLRKKSIITPKKTIDNNKLQIKELNGVDEDFVVLCRRLENFQYDLLPGVKEKGYNLTDDLKDVVGYVLYDGDKPVASIGLKKKTKRTCEIVRVFVDEAYRGNGYAKMLFKKIEDKAFEMEYNKAVMVTWEKSTAALGLYTKLGYKQGQTKVSEWYCGYGYIELSKDLRIL